MLIAVLFPGLALAAAPAEKPPAGALAGEHEQRVDLNALRAHVASSIPPALQRDSAGLRKDVIRRLRETDLAPGSRFRTPAEVLGPAGPNAYALADQLVEGLQARLTAPARQRAPAKRARESSSPVAGVQIAALTPVSTHLGPLLALAESRAEMSPVIQGGLKGSGDGWHKEIDATERGVHQGVKIEIEGVQGAATGNRLTIETVTNNRIKRCPSSAGIVTGEIDYKHFETTQGASAGESATVRSGFHVQGKLEARVGDDARLIDVRLDAAMTIEMTGTVLTAQRGTVHLPARVTRTRVQAVFNPRNGALSGLNSADARAWGPPTLTPQEATEAMAKTLIFADLSVELLSAEEAWNKPGPEGQTCAEIRYTPETLAISVKPAGSTDVKVEIVAMSDGRPAAGSVHDVKPLLANDRVNPTQARSAPERPAALRYSAPPAPWPPEQSHGFSAFGTSRAGKTPEAQWAVLPPSIWLEFHSVIDGVAVVAARSEARARVRISYDTNRNEFVGAGELRFATTPKGPAAPCGASVAGTGATSFDVPAANLGHRLDPATGENSIMVFIRPGDTTETATIVCPGATPRSGPTSFWSAHFNVGRFLLFNHEHKAYEINEWTYVGKDGVLATKTIDEDCAATCKGTTKLILRWDDQ